MALVTKTWVFLADAEGFADAGDSANITFVHDTLDGDPLGSVKFSLGVGPYTETESGLRTLTSETFGTWGVPVGQIVEQVKITAWKYKVDSIRITAHTVKMRLVDENGIPICSDLISTSLPTSAGGWTSGSAGLGRIPDAGQDVSTAQVRLEIEYTATVLGGAVSPSETFFDQITLEIAYQQETPMAIPIQNLDGLVFMKGFAYASRIGGVQDAIGMAALQECSLSHGYSTAEARGPESLQPLGVGITEETLSGSIRYMVCSAEQFAVFIGGTIAYNGGTGKTTWTKKVNEEPSPFNLRLKTPEDGSDLEIIVYNCLSTNQPIIDGGSNREFKVFGVDFRAYGQSPAQGGKLVETLHVGNQTGSS